MALNFAECQAMIEACQQANVPLWVAYYRRGLPRFLKVKALLDSGAIGAPRAVTITFYRQWKPADPHHLPWRVIPEIAGGGLFVDLAAHTLDYLDYFLGPIQAVQGYATNQAGHYPAEDVVVGSFVFQSGVYGTGVWGFSTYTNLDQTEIVGDKGKLTFTSFTEDPIVLTTAAGVTEFPLSNPIHIQQPLIQTIVDELNGAGQCPSSGVSGARTTWVMDQMLAGWRATQAKR